MVRRHFIGLALTLTATIQYAVISKWQYVCVCDSCICGPIKIKQLKVLERGQQPLKSKNFFLSSVSLVDSFFCLQVYVCNSVRNSARERRISAGWAVLGCLKTNCQFL